MISYIPVVLGVSALGIGGLAVHFHVTLSTLKRVLSEAQTKLSSDLVAIESSVRKDLSIVDVSAKVELAKAKAELAKAVGEAKAEVERAKAELQRVDTETLAEIKAIEADAENDIQILKQAAEDIEAKSQAEISRIESRVEQVVSDSEMRLENFAKEVDVRVDSGLSTAKSEFELHAHGLIKNIEQVAVSTSTAICTECKAVVAKFERDASGLAHCINCIHRPRR